MIALLQVLVVVLFVLLLCWNIIVFGIGMGSEEQCPHGYYYEGNRSSKCPNCPFHERYYAQSARDPVHTIGGSIINNMVVWMPGFLLAHFLTSPNKQSIPKTVTLDLTQYHQCSKGAWHAKGIDCQCELDLATINKRYTKLKSLNHQLAGYSKYAFLSHLVALSRAKDNAASHNIT